MLRLLLLPILLGVGSSAIALVPLAPALAEIVPDATLPENSRVDRQGNVRRIEGGTQRGSNLFHSFREFSLPGGGTAYFNNSGAIENIFARVTGRNRSEIDGVLRTNGEANLFLLNPNGILFGPNASLNIGGSFLATTANGIDFADGTQFSTVEPQASSLLTVSVPTGLQFGSNPQPITNRSRFPQGSRNPVGLQISEGETLALVGGQINFSGGTISSSGGRIELGAVGANSLPTQVNLSFTNNGLRLRYEDVQSFQDIRFSEAANVSISSGSGDSIHVSGRNISLMNSSSITADTANTTGGAISIDAAQSIVLRGGSNISTFASGEGRAGNIFIRAGDSIQILGTAPASSDNSDTRPTPSSIGSQVGSPNFDDSELRTITGNGGNVLIETRRLTARGGGSIEASTFGAGNAGNIQIRALDSIELSGANTYGSGVRDQILSGIYAQVGIGAIEEAGDAGTIAIQTGELTLLGGAQISSAARTGGRGGNVDITADNSIRLSGQSPNATETVGRSGIFVSAEQSATRNAGQLSIHTRQLTVENGGEISANNFGPAQGGSISIGTNQLTVRNGGDIRATSFEEKTGQAGNLQISADLINLDGGRLTAETRAGETANANIILQDVDALLIQNQGQLSARALLNAPGGNIFILAPQGFAIAVGQNNDIVADAFRGRGGNITIEAQSILGLEEGRSNPSNLTNDIDASSQFGTPGSVTLIQPDVDPSQGLTELPTDLVDASNLIAQTCSTRGAVARNRSEFVITGRGGLQSSPAAARSVGVTSTDWATLDLDTEQTESWELGSKQQDSPIIAATVGNSSNELIEAQGWVIGEDGDVILVAESPTISQTAGTNIQCQDGSDSEE